mmetsp:Transcript_35466/g.111617  ORF Transcript_35466/g.111617 Transcript_35466/m.111617 type:complete len:274 (-) Transcript_35466:2001-2822(-)
MLLRLRLDGQLLHVRSQLRDALPSRTALALSLVLFLFRSLEPRVPALHHALLVHVDGDISLGSKRRHVGEISLGSTRRIWVHVLIVLAIEREDIVPARVRREKYRRACVPVLLLGRRLRLGLGLRGVLLLRLRLVLLHGARPHGRERTAGSAGLLPLDVRRPGLSLRLGGGQLRLLLGLPLALRDAKLLDALLRLRRPRDDVGAGRQRGRFFTPMQRPRLGHGGLGISARHHQERVSGAQRNVDGPHRLLALGDLFGQRNLRGPKAVGFDADA